MKLSHSEPRAPPPRSGNEEPHLLPLYTFPRDPRLTLGDLARCSPRRGLTRIWGGRTDRLWAQRWLGVSPPGSLLQLQGWRELNINPLGKWPQLNKHTLSQVNSSCLAGQAGPLTQNTGEPCLGNTCHGQ